jgi:hypothetical protein
MRIVLDEHVAVVMKFMQREIPADKLIFVAMAINELAPLFWSEKLVRSTSPIIKMSEDPLSVGMDSVDHKFPSDSSGSAIPT